MNVPVTTPRDPAFGGLPGLTESINAERMLGVFAQTAFNRAFEFEVAAAFEQRHIRAPIYLSIGQEHIPAAIASAHREWQIFAQHRAHSYYLSFGGNEESLVDELLHRPTGCAGGMGGSASIHCPPIRMFGHSGLMGDQVPIAVGAALVSREPTMAVIGDASAEEDYVLAAMGFAATKRAPVLFVCEDNDLSILTHVAVRRIWNMVDVARSLGLIAEDISDDPWLIVHHVQKLVSNLPAFLNVRTCRQRWHAGTGQDGSPEWNRYELFKDALTQGAGRERVEHAEREAVDRASRLWEERLRK